MKKSTVRYLRLDEPALFEIAVAGRLPPDWHDRIDASVIGSARAGPHQIYRLHSRCDQAALQGVLRSLYDLGMAIIGLEVID